MIAIDVDGVVCDSGDYLVREIEERSGKKLVYTKPRSFKFNVDIPERDILRYIESAIIKYKDVIPVCEGHSTLIALYKIQQIYGSINFVTARSKKTEEATKYWLRKNFGRNLEFTVHSLGETSSKRMWMHERGFKTIVEDRFRTANDCASPYTETFLINREWNVGRQENEFVTRVDSLIEAINLHFESRYQDVSV